MYNKKQMEDIVVQIIIGLSVNIISAVLIFIITDTQYSFISFHLFLDSF